MITKISIIVLAVMILLAPARSDETQKTDEESRSSASLEYDIVVTANRVETRSREVASSISVITKEDLERTKKTTVLEALQQIMGISIVQNGPPGSAASVFVRGANSEHTLVLMDGVELNDPITPSRSYDIAHFPVANIERIEILRGPQSTLYGSDALGGVINIITRRRTGKPQIQISTRIGSYGTIEGSTEINGGSEMFNYSLGTSYLRTEGFSSASSLYSGNTEKDGYRNLTISLRLNSRVKENMDLDFTARTASTKTDLDNFGGSYGDDPNSVQNYNSLFMKGQVRAFFLKNRWEQKVSLSFLDYFRTTENPVDPAHPFDSENSEFKSRLWKLEWQNNLYLLETNTLTFGVDHQQEQGESEYNAETLWGSYASTFPLKKTSITGFFLQDQLRIAGRFFLTIGARLDKHSQAGTVFTYRFAPAYFIRTTGTKLKATLGTGFKAPSLYQLYAPATTWGPTGNKDLKPEESTGWDAGIEQYFLENKLILSATYYSNIFRNLIVFIFGRGYVNIGQASSRGVELNIKVRPNDNLLFSAAYTTTEAKDEETGSNLLRRPKYKFSAMVYFRLLEKAHINLFFYQYGKRDDLVYAGWTPVPVSLEGYTLLNAAISWDFFKDAQIFVRLDNLLDKEYETIKGYGTPGFSVYGGLKISF